MSCEAISLQEVFKYFKGKQLLPAPKFKKVRTSRINTKFKVTSPCIVKESEGAFVLIGDTGCLQFCITYD